MQQTRAGKNNIYISISLTLHVLVLLIIVLQFNSNAHHTTPGDSDHNAINAYFVQAAPISTRQERPSNSKQGIALTKKESKPTEQFITSHLRNHAASKGENSAVLLAQLHNEIQKKQSYPESALEMGREGRTTISFRLFRDGHINHAKITHSSGTDSLDLAALAAVKNAMPFHGVAQLVNETGDYSIDVVFEMG